MSHSVTSFIVECIRMAGCDVLLYSIQCEGCESVLVIADLTGLVCEAAGVLVLQQSHARVHEL